MSRRPGPTGVDNSLRLFGVVVDANRSAVHVNGRIVALVRPPRQEQFGP
jgi:hypothetical protein